MIKLYFYFLITIFISILVHGIAQDQTLPALVTVNPVSGILNVSPSNLLVNAPPLSLVEKNLTFSQDSEDKDLNVTLFLEISVIKSWISFSENSFIIKPNEIKDIITFIDIPETTIGIYSGNIHAITNESQDLIIPVDITVTDKYKISVNIDETKGTVQPGENILVFTELTKAKQRKKDPEIEGKITVDLVYNVLKGKNLITTLSTTMDVVDFNSETILITVPVDAPSGRYKVEVTATHLDKTANDRDNFRVGSTNNLSRAFWQVLNFLGFG